MCIGITSGLGRLVFGKIADMERANRIALQQISFVSIGICTMLLTAAPFFGEFTFTALVVIALIMGLFDGCFITMLGPIAFDICGPNGASQAIGFLLGMCSIPLTIGPPIAGTRSKPYAPSKKLVFAIDFFSSHFQASFTISWATTLWPFWPPVARPFSGRWPCAPSISLATEKSLLKWPRKTVMTARPPVVYWPRAAALQGCRMLSPRQL